MVNICFHNGSWYVINIILVHKLTIQVSMTKQLKKSQIQDCIQNHHEKHISESMFKFLIIPKNLFYNKMLIHGVDGILLVLYRTIRLNF